MVSCVYDFNSQNRDLKYNKNHKLSLSSPCLGSFFRIPILLFEINNFIFTSFFSFFMSIGGQCGSYMPALLVIIPSHICRSRRHKDKS